MKKIIFLTLITLSSFLTFAQSGNQKISTEVKRQIEVLKNSSLNLSEIQLSRLTSVLIGEEQISDRMKKALEGNKAILETRLAELKVNRINNIKGGLTEVQAEKFDALHLADKL